MVDLHNSLELLQLFGETTRLRLLALLQLHELTVAELTTVTDLGQSRVSTHLGKLREAGLLRDRRVGTSTHYSLNELAMPEAHAELWQWLQGQLDDQVLRSDAERAAALVAARHEGTRWPDTIAGEMERHYSPGRTWEATARGFAGMLRLGSVLDVGSGDGVVAQLLAPRAEQIHCIDKSERLLSAARARLSRHPHIRYSVGDMHALPVGEASVDHVLMFHVLTYSHAPARALAEAARVLRPGGTLALVTLDAHGNLDETAAYQHLQPGFAPSALRALLERAHLLVESYQVTSREKRSPNFQVVSAFAHRPRLDCA